MKQGVLLAGILVIYGSISVANAQTFAPQGPKLSKTTSAQAVQSPVLDKSGNIKKNELSDTLASKTAVTSSNNNNKSSLPPSRINIGGKDNGNDNSIYDNTIPRVIHFELKDGKFIFDDDDKRDVLVWYENFKVSRGIDGITRCSMRIFVLNDLHERITSLGIKLIWPDIRTNVNMVKINTGVKTYSDVVLMGDGCFTMDKTPVVEVNRCRVKGMTEEKCAEAVHWFGN